MKKLEEEHQKALIKWASYRPDVAPYLIHIPNGGSRHKAEARNLKLAGVKPGVPDLLLCRIRRGYGGLWIEMKRPIIGTVKPKLSVYQKEFIQRLEEENYLVAVCYGWHQARDVIIEYMG